MASKNNYKLVQRYQASGKITNSIQPIVKNSSDHYITACLEKNSCKDALSRSSDNESERENNNKNNSNSVSRAKKGKKGISKKGIENIANGITILAKEYSIDNLYWLVIKFNHLDSIEQIERLVTNNKELIRKIQYVLNKDKTVKDSYVISIGIQRQATFDKGIPCYDINILLPINSLELVQDIYKGISKLAKDLIPIPNDLYYKKVNNKHHSIEALINYLAKKQTNSRILKKIEDKYLFNQWSYLPIQLKQKIKQYEVRKEYTNINTVNPIREVIEESYSNELNSTDIKLTDYVATYQVKDLSKVNIKELSERISNDIHCYTNKTIETENID